MMKTTTSSSIRVKPRRDAGDVSAAGREDSSSIGFDTSGRVDDQRHDADRLKSRPGTITEDHGHTGLSRRL